MGLSYEGPERKKKRSIPSVLYHIVTFVLVIVLLGMVARDMGWAKLPNGNSQISAYSVSSQVSSEICEEVAMRAGRQLAKVDILPGFRGGAKDVKETDTFVCHFTSGETMPFMITIVDGNVTDVQ